MTPDEPNVTPEAAAPVYLFPVAPAGPSRPITDTSVYFQDTGPVVSFSFAILNGDYLFSALAKAEGSCLHLLADKLTVDLLNLYLTYEEEALKATLRHANFEMEVHFADRKQLVGFVTRAERWTVGADLDRFEAVRDLDKGSFGAVRLMKDGLKDGKLVTLKTVPVPAEPEKEGLRPILNEVDVLRRLRHPNVLKLYSVLHVKGQVVLITEYIAGGTLEGRLAKGPMPLPEALETTRGLLQAVRATHGQKYVHRDIKPANVMWKDSKKKRRKWKLIDFGLSEDYTDQSPASLMRDRTGTVCYMAPEILNQSITGGVYSHHADLFSVGVVLIEL